MGERDAGEEEEEEEKAKRNFSVAVVKTERDEVSPKNIRVKRTFDDDNGADSPDVRPFP